eukprot:scaffold321592_cov13-Tisochrysis_lutea.AAC.1
MLSDASRPDPNICGAESKHTAHGRMLSVHPCSKAESARANPPFMCIHPVGHFSKLDAGVDNQDPEVVLL